MPFLLTISKGSGRQLDGRSRNLSCGPGLCMNLIKMVAKAMQDTVIDQWLELSDKKGHSGTAKASGSVHIRLLMSETIPNVRLSIAFYINVDRLL